MPLECRSIVLALISKQLPEFLDRRRILDQMVPVVMRDLVPEMAHQRAVRLTHRLALTFALRRVGLRRVQRDEAAGMPGHDRRLPLPSVRRAREEIKRQSVGILRSACQRQPQPQQRVKKSMLGVLDLAPVYEILGI